MSTKWTPINTIQPLVDKVTTQVFTASGTYTPTTGMVYCIIQVVGGGGGGGGCIATNTSAGTIPNPYALGTPGGGSGYYRGTFAAATIGASQTVTIGAGGAGGTAGNHAGTAGGSTTVGSLITVAGGGAGSGSGAAAITTIFYNPTSGAGGVLPTSTGDFMIAGGAGYAYCFENPSGVALGYDTAILVPFNGGQSWFSYGNSLGVNSANGGTPGQLGIAYGSGGMGSTNSKTINTAYAGGAGIGGIVIITEYISV